MKTALEQSIEQSKAYIMHLLSEGNENPTCVALAQRIVHIMEENLALDTHQHEFSYNAGLNGYYNEDLELMPIKDASEFVKTAWEK